MEKVTIHRVSSGFANIEDNLVTDFCCSTDGLIYTSKEYFLPDGFEVGLNKFGEKMIYGPGDTCWEPFLDGDDVLIQYDGKIRYLKEA